MDGWMNQAYGRLSTTHGHITDCKLLVCMYWTRLVLVRTAASLYNLAGTNLKYTDSEKGDWRHHTQDSLICGTHYKGKQSKQNLGTYQMNFHIFG